MYKNLTIHPLEVKPDISVGDYAAVLNNENMQDHYLVTAFKGRQLTSPHKWLMPGDQYVTGFYSNCMRIECHGRSQSLQLLPFATLTHPILIVQKSAKEMEALAQSRAAEKRHYLFTDDSYWFKSDEAA